MNFETAADSFIRPTIGRQAVPAHAAVQTQRDTAADAAGRDRFREQGAKAEHETAAMELEFADLLDVINPLQHIPVVSSLYRELTGDEIKAPARVLGGFLFGGPVGLVGSVANAAIEEASGRDLGETVMAWAFGAGDDGSANLAEAPRPAETPAETLAGIAPAAGAPTPAVPAAPAAASAIPPAAAGMPATVMTSGESEPRPNRAAAPAAPSRDGAPDARPDAPPDAGGEAAAGPMLSGKAAVAAFVNDLKAVGRSAASAVGAAADPVAQAAETPSAETPPARPVPENLVGLGIRDRRGRSVAAPPAPPAVLQIPGAAGGPAVVQPASAQAAAHTDGAAPADGGPDGGESASAPADFSAQMMQALQKYQSMLQQRDGGNGRGN